MGDSRKRRNIAVAKKKAKKKAKPPRNVSVPNEELLVEELATSIATVLRHRADEFNEHRLGAVALDAAPWHRYLEISVLIETDQDRKWDIGDWEHQYFSEDCDVWLADTPSLDKFLDTAKEDRDLDLTYFRVCARALCHDVVTEALELYSLEPDFEVFVSNPDDPNDVNFCEEFVGVHKDIRKPKTEITGDLDEALKDPESVLVLQYGFIDDFTEEADRKIARLINLQELHMWSAGLTALPNCVQRLLHLRELWLDKNSICSLEGISQLNVLRVLSLRDNGFLNEEMIDAIASLTSLERLYLGHCGLTEVPSAFQRLTRLAELYVFGNSFSEIPDWVLSLPRLEKLGLVESVSEKNKQALAKAHPHIEIW